MKKKIVAFILVFALALALGIGGTMAWLTAESGKVVNTFTVGDINITLDEVKLDAQGEKVTDGDGKEVRVQKNDYYVVPGSEYIKDPKVTVTAGSEDCWLFIKVTEKGGVVTVEEDGKSVEKTFDNFVTYEIDTTKWSEMPGHAGYYYYKSDNDTAVSAGESVEILVDNKIAIKNTVTKAMSNALNADKTANTADDVPTLVFAAAAVQSENVADVNAAWNALPTAFTSAS